MKIAVLAPPWLSIPPVGYGGIEWVVSNLIDGLVKKNHEVVLYATGDSKGTVPIKYFYEKALGNSKGQKLNPYHIIAHLYHFYKNYASSFDIIHCNASEIAVFFSDFTKTPNVFTLHNNYTDNPQDILAEYGWADAQRKSLMLFKNLPYVSISNSQRLSIPELNYVKTIHNGIRPEDFIFNARGGDHIKWLGRIDPVKGIDAAIEVVKKSKKKLYISGFLDPGKKNYFDTVVYPQISEGNVKQEAEIKTLSKKSEFLGDAKLFLFPLLWEEPFGIVMIESMATGTPVIAYARGSVPEVIKDGETGFIVNSSDSDIRGDWIIKKTGIEGLCEAVERIYTMSEEKYLAMRRSCRAHVEAHFTVSRMVDEYVRVYEEILNNKN